MIPTHHVYYKGGIIRVDVKPTPFGELEAEDEQGTVLGYLKQSEGEWVVTAEDPFEDEDIPSIKAANQTMAVKYLVERYKTVVSPKWEAETERHFMMLDVSVF